MVEINTRMGFEILTYFSNNRCQATKKEIHRHIKVRMDFINSNHTGNTTVWSKTDIKRALKHLVKQGCITKDDKTYTFVFNPNASDGGSDCDDATATAEVSVARKMQSGSDSGDVSEDVISEEDEKNVKGTSLVLPIAKRMRQTTNQEPINDDNSGAPTIDLDDEIARLEAELAADNSESYDEDSESDDQIEQRITGPPSKKAISFGANSMHEYDSGNGRSRLQEDGRDDNFSASGIISLSNLADDRIAPLPQSALPQNKRRKLKIDSTAPGDITEMQSNAERKKRKRSSEPAAEQCHQLSAGLKSAVADLLQNYVPSSQLALPFYCRVCQHQSPDRKSVV